MTFSVTSIAFAAPESKDTEDVSITSDEYVEEQNNEIMLMTADESHQSYQASIGDINYTSFTDALNAAKDGDIITLLTSLSCSNDNAASIKLAKDNLTIDLNSQTLDFNLVRFSVEAKGIMIKNGTINATDCAIQIPERGRIES